MELKINSVVTLILCWNSLCAASYKHKTAAHSVIYERNAEESPETLSGKTNTQVRPTASVQILSGETLELQCEDEANEGLVQFWQTPFGLFNSCSYGLKDPIQTCNGSLKMSRVTSAHSGLYCCVQQDKTNRTIVPYRVNVMGFNPNQKTHLRQSREVRTDAVPDSHFLEAVISSVFVTFVVAFTLGAFSRSYVIKCLRMARTRIPYRKSNHIHTSGNDPQLNTNTVIETVMFHKNQDTGEDTVDIVTNQVVQQDLDGQESTNAGDVDDITNGTSDGDKIDEPNELQNHEEQNQESKLVVSPHPKKKSRVIKLYNYDEEGNQYSHIKDSGVEVEDEVRPKLRSKSLTRLDAIMKQAEGPHVDPVKEPTDGQPAVEISSDENSPSTAAENGNTQVSEISREPESQDSESEETFD